MRLSPKDHSQRVAVEDLWKNPAPRVGGCTAPWLDLDRNVAGVFMVVNLMENVFPGVQQLKAAVRAAVDNTPCHHPPYLQIQPAGGNTNLVTLHGARGRSYALESSGNLATWTNYLTLSGTNGLWEISVAATNAPQQFLRAKILP